LAVFDTENLRGNRAGIPSTLNYDTRFFYKEHLYKELEAEELLLELARLKLIKNNLWNCKNFFFS